MKVFVSSTCYDLMDLRAELFEDLREYGVEAHFSDAKDSDFIVPSAAGVHSIDACLASLRECELVIFILSQRYGRPLGGPFGNLSATHCEYNEAKQSNKKILFYVRNDLWGDFSVWRRNGRSTDFNPVWANKKDAIGLFTLIEDHVTLVGEDGKADKNNWRTTFSNSVDLRADVKRQLKPQAVRATAERMIEKGEVPFLIANGIRGYNDFISPARSMFSVQVDTRNVGPMVAFNISARVQFWSGLITQKSDIIPVLSPGETNMFNIRLSEEETAEIKDRIKNNLHSTWIRVYFNYYTPAGFTLNEKAQIDIFQENDSLIIRGNPSHVGKYYEGPFHLILPG